MNLDTPDRVAAHLAYIVAMTGGDRSGGCVVCDAGKCDAGGHRECCKEILYPERRTIMVLKGAAQ